MCALLLLRTLGRPSVLQRAHDKLNASRCRCDRQRPQFRNEPQDVVEENFRNGDLGHLEGDSWSSRM